MTGRRLYDLYCDAHEDLVHDGWAQAREGGQTRAHRLAWPALTADDRRMWNRVASRLKGTKRS